MSKMEEMVVDASVVLKWVLVDSEEDVEEAKQWYDRSVTGEVVLVAPDILVAEITNVMFWKKGFDREQTVGFLDHLEGKINCMPIGELGKSEVLETMEKYKVSVYDAYYLVLAMKKQTKVITLDKKLLTIEEWCVGVK